MTNFKNKIVDFTGVRRITLDSLTWDLRLLFLRLRNHIFPTRLRRLRYLSHLSNICLNFGSGPHIIPGWINIDAYPYPGLNAELDLRYPLPFAMGSCRLILAEHVLEHFTPIEAINICQEFYRILQPDGVCRIIVPDAEKYWQAYQTRNFEWFQTVDAPCNIPLEGVNSIYYNHYHKWMYDFELLNDYLLNVGFTRIVHSTHRSSEFDELRVERDDLFRKESSLYIDAIKE